MTDADSSGEMSKSERKRVPIMEIFHKNTETSSSFLKDVWKPRDNIKNIKGDTNYSSSVRSTHVNTNISGSKTVGSKNCLQVQDVFQNGCEEDEDDSTICRDMFCPCKDKKDNRYVNDFEMLKSYKAEECTPVHPFRLLAFISYPGRDDSSSSFSSSRTRLSDSDDTSVQSSRTGQLLAALVPLISNKTALKNKDENITQNSDTETHPETERPPPKPPRGNTQKLMSSRKFEISVSISSHKQNAQTICSDTCTEGSDSQKNTTDNNMAQLNQNDTSQINITEQKVKWSVSVDSGQRNQSDESRILSEHQDFSHSLPAKIGYSKDNSKPFTMKTLNISTSNHNDRDETKNNSKDQSTSLSLNSYYNESDNISKDESVSLSVNSSFDNTFFNDDISDFEESCILNPGDEHNIENMSEHFPHEEFMDDSKNFNEKDTDLPLDSFPEDEEFDEFYSDETYHEESHCHNHQHACNCNQFIRNQHMLYDLCNSAGLEIHDVVPDGNCMFRAIVDQLRMQGEITATCSQIRQKAVSYLRKNPLQEDGTHLEDFFVAGEESWEQYLSRMSKDGEWGDQIILRGLAEVINREICIISTIGNQHNQTTITPNSAEGELKNIYLGHVNDQHYYSLRPKGWQNIWYKEARKIQPSHQDRAKPTDLPQEALAFPCRPSTLINCDTKHIDYSGVPVFHLNFIMQNVLQRDDIKTPYQLYTREQLISQCFLEEFDMVGSVEEDLSVNLYAFTLTPEYSVGNKNFNASKVSKIPNFYKSMEDAFVLFENESSKLRSNVIIINCENTHPGYTNLELPDGHSRRNHKKVNGSYYLSSSVFTTKRNDSKMWHKSRHRKYVVSPFQKGNDITFYHKCPRWPNEANDWINRNRPSGWPSMAIIKEILEIPCVLTTGHHPNSENPDIEWKFDFSFPERFLLKENISEDQKYCFHVFKLLIDFHTGRMKELSTFVLKTIFLYTLEVIPLHRWDSCPSACVLYMIDILHECLMEGQIPHYFIPENNIISHIDKKNLNILVEKVDMVREFPIMSIIIMAENHGVMTTYITDQIIEDINHISEGSSIHDSILHTFIPAYTKMTATSLSLQKFRQAVSAVTTGYKMLKDLFQSDKGQVNPYENMSLVSFINEATQGMYLYQAWWLCFFVDLYKGENTLSSFLSTGPCKKIGEMLVDCPPGDLDHISVPYFVFSYDDHDSFSKEKEQVSFFMSLCTFLTKEGEYKLLAHYLRGIIKTLTQKLHNPDAIMAELLHKSHHGGMTDKRFEYTMQSYMTSLYGFLFHFLHSLYVCYLQKGQTEYFQEYIEQFESVCDILATPSSYQSLSDVWKTLGNRKKINEAIQKQRSLATHSNQYTF